MPWFNSKGPCTETNYTGGDFNKLICGNDANSYIGGSTPVEAEAALVAKNMFFTSVTVNVFNNYTVAFIGTSDGKILKVSCLAVSIE